jgi:hypothetical protein
MREREFRAIFCFCPGYEAAMLWTCTGKESEDDPWMSLLPCAKQLPNTQVGTFSACLMNLFFFSFTNWTT